MNYKIPSQEELRTDLVLTLMLLKIRDPDYLSEVARCIEVIEGPEEDMPPKPRHLRLVQGEK
jgi:hypothetical protein